MNSIETNIKLHSVEAIETAIREENLTELTSIIQEAIKVKGYIHITNQMSTEFFETIGNQLGKVLTMTDVKVDKISEKKAINARAYRGKDRPITYSAKEISFHSDSPIQKLIGFYCIEQDEIDGSLMMLDMEPIMEHLSEEELSILKSIKVNWANLEDGKEVINEACLFSEGRDNVEVYYASWHLQQKISANQQEVLTRFQNFIKQTQEQQLLKIRLKKGETIFVNNRRMLHAREKIADNSKRHIIRLGIGSAV